MCVHPRFFVASHDAKNYIQYLEFEKKKLADKIPEVSHKLINISAMCASGNLKKKRANCELAWRLPLSYVTCLARSVYIADMYS